MKTLAFGKEPQNFRRIISNDQEEFSVSIDRSEFTKLACDPKHSVLIEACAGSGKTWLLVARLFRLLLDGAPPQKILAITFTKKAANEMQSRLMDLLKRCSTANDEDLNQILNERGIVALDLKPFRERARLLLSEVLQIPQGLQVSTFHSFFMQLINCAPMSMTTMTARLLREDTDYLRADFMNDFWQGITSQQNSDVYSAYKGLLDKGVESKTIKAWVKTALSQRIMGKMAPPISLYIREKLMNLGDASYDPEKPITENKFHYNFWTQFCSEHRSDKGVLVEKLLENIEQALKKNDIGQILQVILTKDGQLNQKRIHKNINLADIDPMTWQPLIDAYQYPLMQQIDRFLQGIKDAYETYLYKNGIRDFDELEAGVWHWAHHPEEGSGFYTKLDRDFHHILIDEFQDTSPVQWELLRGWLSQYGANDSQRPTIFLVGDRKQAIYRFREADSRLMHVVPRWFDQVKWPLYRLQTNHSYRCGQAVLDFLNAALVEHPKINATEVYVKHTGEHGRAVGAVYLIADPLSDQSPTVEISSSSSIDSQLNESEEQLTMPSEKLSCIDDINPYVAEARRVSAWLMEQQSLHTNWQWSDVLILVRQKTHIAQYVQTFRENLIPVTASLNQSLLRSPEISDLIAVLKFCANPGNDLCLAQLLKCPIFSVMHGTSDVDLIAIRHAHQLINSQLKIERSMGGSNGDLSDSTDEGYQSSQLSWWDVLLLWKARDQANAKSAEPIHSVADTIFEIDALCEPLNWPSQLASFPTHLKTVVEFLLRWIDLSQQLTIHEFIDVVFHDACVKACYAATVPPAYYPQVELNLNAFLRLALDFGAGRYPDLGDFLNEVEKKSLTIFDQADGTVVAHAAASNAVRIMTIHAAKGLESPYVIVLDADHRHTPPLNWFSKWRLDLDGVKAEVSLPLLLPFKFKNLESSTVYQSLVIEENRWREEEYWNLFYVAITRAQNVLVISQRKSKRSRNAMTWWELAVTGWQRFGGHALNSQHFQLLNAVGSIPIDTVNAEQPTLDKRQIDSDSVASLHNVYSETHATQKRLRRWEAGHLDVPIRFGVTTDRLSPSTSTRETIEKQLEQEQGIVWHQSMQIFFNGNWQHTTHVISDMTVTRFIDQFNVSEAIAEFVVKALKILICIEPLWRYWDASSYRRAHNELTIMDVEGSWLRLDRVVWFENCVTIIDYKRSFETAYLIDAQQQLARYRKALAQYTTLPIETILVSSCGDFKVYKYESEA